MDADTDTGINTGIDTDTDTDTDEDTGTGTNRGKSVSCLACFFWKMISLSLNALLAWWRQKKTNPEHWNNIMTSRPKIADGFKKCTKLDQT